MKSEPKVHPLIEQGDIYLIAGVYDALSAKLAERAGFHAVVVTGYGVSASLLGEPDFGLMTQTELIDTARRICNAVSIPVSVDGDTGYGGALNVFRLVSALKEMGARGVLLEDQTWPKRCGHMRGKEVIPAEEHAQKIRAAVEARGDYALMITARTDALAVHGLDEAIHRANLYKQAGADLIFVEAPRTVDDLREIGRQVPPPLVINCIEGGQTPLLSLEELKALGFIAVGYVLSGLYASAKALADVYACLREHGTSAPMRDRMMDFNEFAEVIGLKKKYELDERFRA
ncbi:oxaloacetate decarboxylase [Candidatus Poribacteria bacterium]|nr:oxaloacetate decarboxylase [Candidatus Poribacteria bacterium]